MESKVENPEVAAGLDTLAAGIDQVFAAGLDPVDSRDATVLVREIERQTRRMQAVQNDVLTAIEQRGLHRHDGHGSAKVMVRHVADLSDDEAARRAKTAHALADLPVVAGAFRAGDIGRPQTDRISRAHANPRVRQKLCEQDRKLAALARRECYRFFDQRLADWIRQSDEDGTCDQNQRNHENRDAALIQEPDDSWAMRARWGSLQGAEALSIFEHFIDAEWRTDWEKARAEYGDAATTAHLCRTDNQRRADALFNILQRAAASDPTGKGAQIITNLLLDHDTFERSIRRMTGQRPPAPDIDLYDFGDSGGDSNGNDGPNKATDTDACPSGDRASKEGPRGASDTASEAEATAPAGPQPGPARTDHAATQSRAGRIGYRSSTIDGHPVDPTEAVAQALLGHIRRVVLDADSTVIDLSRRRRLFTGAAALAVKLSNYECYWPGCHVNVSNCQIDHLIPWANHNGGGDDGGGSTNPGNGGPACGRHNRLKEKG